MNTTVSGEGLKTPSLALQHAQMVESVLNGLSEGKSHAAIGQWLGIAPSHVSRIVKELADAARQENRERVSEAMMVQDKRLEWLYAHCAKRIKKAAEDDVFDKEAVRLAIMALERQSRLLGLDAVQTMGRQQRDWLTDQPDSVLIREAERWGIKLPEKFAKVGQDA